MEYDYSIHCLDTQDNIHSIDYLLKEKNTKNELIVKIYEKPRHIYYNKEKDILDILNNKFTSPESKFFLMYKNKNYYQNMFRIPKEVKGDELKFLFYDYLPNLSLFEYLKSEFNDQINEAHAKFLCVELLNIIKKLHKNNIVHKNINIKNIMFDEYFNIKIIHFCEASRINDNEKYKLREDIFGLAKTLFKILTRGKFYDIEISKSSKEYVYMTNNPTDLKNKNWRNKQNFLDMLKKLYNINISKEFLDFFYSLVKAYYSKQILDIDKLLNNIWLKEINTNVQKYEKEFKKDFNKILRSITEFNIKDSILFCDTNDLFNLGENQAFAIKKEIFKDKLDKESYPSKKINFNEKFCGPPPNIIKMKGLKPRKLEKDPNTNKINENNTIYSGKQIENKTTIINISQQYNIIDDSKKSLLRGAKKGVNNTANIEKKIYTPRRTDFNYLEINIKNEENKDLNQALINFMNIFKNKIKEYYVYEEINVHFENMSDTSFKICYEIPPLEIDGDIEFLDEEFEKKVKNFQNFEIKVELFDSNTINQYYLVFNGISVDKEDFYDHLKLLKTIVKTLFKKNDN